VTKAVRKVDRAEAEACSIRMKGCGALAWSSSTIAQWLNGGTGWVEVKCHVRDEAEHPLSDRFRGTLLFRNAIRKPYSE
jgi:hypothetical protein